MLRARHHPGRPRRPGPLLALPRRPARHAQSPLARWVRLRPRRHEPRIPLGSPGADTRNDVFNFVRRAKTTWPDRPVFWLGDGLKVEKLAVIQYNFKAPTKPLLGRNYFAYTESLAAWMAGADPGWGCIWCFRAC